MYVCVCGYVVLCCAVLCSIVGINKVESELGFMLCFPFLFYHHI